MMLLNNDYYLDMKETLISQELSAIISNTNLLYDTIYAHINDNAKHGSKVITRVNNNYYGQQGSNETTVIEKASFENQGILTQDTVVYLSILDSVVKINEKISNIPHNLNGHNLAFIFVVPSEYAYSNKDDEIGSKEGSEYYKYILNVGNNCIRFSNFFNGTLFSKLYFLNSI